MPKRIAVIGVGPLPIYQGQSSMGPGIRTWQLAKPLARKGHQLLLVTFEFALRTGWDYSNPEYIRDIKEFGAIEHLSLPEPQPSDFEERIREVEQRIVAFQPEVVVSAGAFFASRIAASLQVEQPLWIDLFGNTMSEVQAKVARSSQDESGFFRFLYQTQMKILRRGDSFSALSNPQKLAAVGELSLAGRLNDKNLGCDLVSVIPCGYDEEGIQNRKRTVLRGVQVKAEDFVVLWTGGFNSWVDETTLFDGLLSAMRRDSSIRWVSLGGGISGHFQEGYAEFRRRAEASSLKDRFLFLDWIPTDEVVDYFFESDIGINVDLPIYEALLGGRNRIVGWMAAGLPVLTTEMTEISHMIKERNIGFTVPVQRPDLLADKLLEIASQRHGLPDIGSRAKEYATQHLTFSATTTPLIEWIETPCFAPDHEYLRKQKRRHLNTLDETLDGFVNWLEQGDQPTGQRRWKTRLASMFGK